MSTSPKHKDLVFDKDKANPEKLGTLSKDKKKGKIWVKIYRKHVDLAKTTTAVFSLTFLRGENTTKQVTAPLENTGH